MDEQELLAKIRKVALIISSTKEFAIQNGVMGVRQKEVDVFRLKYLLNLLGEFNKMIIDSAGGLPEDINENII